MSKQYKVAVLGNHHSDQDEPRFFYGTQCQMKVLDLTVEEICSTVEKIDLNGFNDKEMDSRPATTYELQGGGRMYPPVSRETVAKAMQGVEMVIVTVSSWQMNWVFLDVFRGMMEENLEESCIFIFKLVSDPNAPVPHNFILAGNLLTSFGFSSGKRSSKQNKYVVADPKLGGQGVKESVEKIRAKLHGKGTSQKLYRPVKETLSAGKKVLSSGRSLFRWMGKLITSS